MESFYDLSLQCMGSLEKVCCLCNIYWSPKISPGAFNNWKDASINRRIDGSENSSSKEKKITLQDLAGNKKKNVVSTSPVATFALNSGF